MEEVREESDVEDSTEHQGALSRMPLPLGQARDSPARQELCVHTAA